MILPVSKISGNESDEKPQYQMHRCGTIIAHCGDPEKGSFFVRIIPVSEQYGKV